MARPGFAGGLQGRDMPARQARWSPGSFELTLDDAYRISAHLCTFAWDARRARGGARRHPRGPIERSFAPCRSGQSWEPDGEQGLVTA